MHRQCLIVESADRPGLVHEITGVLFRAGVNVVQNHEHVDEETRRFFMRTEYEGQVAPGAMQRAVEALGLPDARVRVVTDVPKRIAILASREHHCLADLLIRHAFGELQAKICVVASNHDSLRPLVEKFEVSYCFLPAEDISRAGHEERVAVALEPFEPELLVLAKYMRVLSPDFLARWPNRILNIHHSFLPAFVGARPYRQAYRRGVKIIGATAHFVTEELDAGPIVVQQVISVDHSHTERDLAQAGRDVEQIVLARALKLVLEDRVLLCGNRTVIFD